MADRRLHKRMHVLSMSENLCSENSMCSYTSSDLNMPAPYLRDASSLSRQRHEAMHGDVHGALEICVVQNLLEGWIVLECLHTSALHVAVVQLQQQWSSVS